MFKQKEVNKKFILISNILFFLFIGVLCIIQFLDYTNIQTINITDIDNNDTVEWAIDKIKVDRNFIAISGYAFIEGEQPKLFDLNVVLKNTDEDQAIKIPTVLVIREELEDNAPDGIDYSQSGFLAKVSRNAINFNSNTYEIYLKYFNNDHQIFVKTNQLISENVGE